MGRFTGLVLSIAVSMLGTLRARTDAFEFSESDRVAAQIYECERANDNGPRWTIEEPIGGRHCAGADHVVVRAKAVAKTLHADAHPMPGVDTRRREIRGIFREPDAFVRALYAVDYAF